MLHRIQPKKRLIIVSAVLLLIGLCCFLFFKIKKRHRPLSAPPLAATFRKKHFETGVLLLSEFNDLENVKGRTISAEKSSSGIKSCKFSLSAEYGYAYIKKLADLPSFKTLRSVQLDIKCWARNDLAGAQYLLAVEDKTGKNIAELSKPVVCYKTYEWNSLRFTYRIDPKLLDAENTIKLYAWNKGLREFYVDDISVSFFGEKDKNAAGGHAYKSNTFYDFESPDSALSTQSHYIKQGIAHSGKSSFDLGNGDEYGPIVNRQFGDVCAELVKKVNMSVWVYPLTDNATVELAVSLFGPQDKSYFWQGKTVGPAFLPKEKWTKINASTMLPAEGSTPDDVIQAIVRNKGKTKMLIDDMEVVYDDMAEPAGNPSSIDPTALYEKKYTAGRNKPPFQTLFLQKQEINNNNGTFITDQKSPYGTSDLSPGNNFLVGDFVPDKNGLDEIICLKKNSQGMVSWSPETHRFITLWENANSADSIWNAGNDFYSGDFNSDKKADVLVVNKKTKDWGIINFNGESWKTMGKGTGPKPEWINKKEPPASDIIQPADVVLQGNFADEKTSVLRFSTSWRFELQWLMPEADSYTILGNVDFKGYPDDHNPKYYEFVKIIAGNFTDNKKASLIVIMRNCADADFNGKACRKYENLDYLPNSTQLYQFE